MAAQDPTGSTINSGVGGWTFTRNGNNEITITHPLGKPVVNIMSHAKNVNGNYMSRNLSGLASQSVAFQNSGATTINLPVLTTQFTGIDTAAGSYMYITFQVPSNNFYI